MTPRPTAWNDQRNMPVKGADIYRINLQTRAIEQLTHQEFTPNTGAGNWDETNPVNPPTPVQPAGLWHLEPGTSAGGGRQSGLCQQPQRLYPHQRLIPIQPCNSLSWMRMAPMSPGSAPLNIGSALHPTPLKDGRIMFSSYESQGLRDQRVWGLWSIWPDGRHWEPLVSAFKGRERLPFCHPTQQ